MAPHTSVRMPLVTGNIALLEGSRISDIARDEVEKRDQVGPAVAKAGSPVCGFLNRFTWADSNCRRNGDDSPRSSSLLQSGVPAIGIH